MDDELNNQILRLWDRGLDTVDITTALNAAHSHARHRHLYEEAFIHRVLIRARQARRILPTLDAGRETA